MSLWLISTLKVYWVWVPGVVMTELPSMTIQSPDDWQSEVGGVRVNTYWDTVPPQLMTGSLQLTSRVQPSLLNSAMLTVGDCRAEALPKQENVWGKHKNLRHSRTYNTDVVCTNWVTTNTISTSNHSCIEIFCNWGQTQRRAKVACTAFSLRYSKPLIWWIAWGFCLENRWDKYTFC